jgi:hypothetical protein
MPCPIKRHNPWLIDYPVTLAKACAGLDQAPDSVGFAVHITVKATSLFPDTLAGSAIPHPDNPFMIIQQLMVQGSLPTPESNSRWGPAPPNRIPNTQPSLLAPSPGIKSPQHDPDEENTADHRQQAADPHDPHRQFGRQGIQPLRRTRRLALYAHGA